MLWIHRLQPGAGDGGLGEPAVEQPDDNIRPAAKLKDVSFDAGERALDHTNPPAKLQRGTDQAALVAGQVKYTLKIIHLFSGNDE